MGSSRAEEAAGEREREKRERWLEEKQKADFLAYFGTGFLLSQAIKSASIYRR